MTKKCRKLIFVFILLQCLVFPLGAYNFVISVRGQKPSEAVDKYATRLRTFEDFARQQMKADKTVGITIGFFKDDYVWVKAFGYSDLENKISAKPESAYRLASITKPMTAIAVLQLAEQGKIDLDAEIQKYVPYFPKKKFPITVRQLLGHLGGIPAYKTQAESRIKEHKNTRESIDIFVDYELVAEPDTRFYYSSYGYNLLGAVIESASGKSYGEYLRENLWRPLAMNDTRMDDPLEIIPNRVRGYQLIDGKIRNSEFVDISSRFASGGTRSSVIDLLKFARGTIDGKLLSREMSEQMWTPMTTKDKHFTAYGMGWWTDSSNGRFIVSHGGSQNETQTALMILPLQNFAIAAAMNFESATPYPYTDKLYRLVLDEPWSINVYTANERDRTLLRGMDEAFDYGMRFLDQFDRPLTTDTNELSEAFAFFSRISELSTTEAADWVNQGRHPLANQAFVKMASFMGAKLRDNNPQKFNDYYRRGAINFFADYINWYRTNPNHPAAFKFTVEFEKQISQWNDDWNKTWNDETSRLDLTLSTDWDKTGQFLRKDFKGATVYPNYASKIEGLGDIYLEQREIEKALKAGQLSVDLYPDSPTATAAFGTALIAAGDKEKALAIFKKAANLAPNGAGSANSLNRYAYFLSSKGQTEAGLRLLETAIEIYPREPNLYDSTGEFYLTLGQKSKAIEFYAKALEIAPNYSNAEKAKELLKKLNQE